MTEGNELRKRFISDVHSVLVFEDLQHVVVAIKLPTGAIELISNSQQLRSKLMYYINAYDDNFCLKTNPAIQIVGYMIV